MQLIKCWWSVISYGLMQVFAFRIYNALIRDNGKANPTCKVFLLSFCSVPHILGIILRMPFLQLSESLSVSQEPTGPHAFLEIDERTTCRWMITHAKTLGLDQSGLGFHQVRPSAGMLFTTVHRSAVLSMGGPSDLGSYLRSVWGCLFFFCRCFICASLSCYLLTDGV